MEVALGYICAVVADVCTYIGLAAVGAVSGAEFIKAVANRTGDEFWKKQHEAVARAEDLYKANDETQGVAAIEEEVAAQGGLEVFGEEEALEE